MRRYSASVDNFLAGFLAPYQRRWRLDYASFRPLEEEGRDLPVRRRNDLLHTDAFPTRPTRGWRILRFFHNIHPTRTRDWVVGDPFSKVVNVFAPRKLARQSRTRRLRARQRVWPNRRGWPDCVPQWKRTPYDEFMMQLHNAMKEDAAFQSSCAKENFEFCAGFELDGLHRDRAARRARRPVRAGADISRRSRSDGHAGIGADFYPRKNGGRTIGLALRRSQPSGLRVFRIVLGDANLLRQAEL